MGIEKALDVPEKETGMELKLWEHDIPYRNDGAETPNTLHTYLIPTDKPLPCVIVFAGGAYRCRAPHEAEPYAQFFNSRGLQAVTVDYRVSPNRFPAGLADAQRAVKLVRSHAAEWGIDPNRVVVCGSSAGGHLAASALLYDDVTMPAGHTRCDRHGKRAPERCDSLLPRDFGRSRIRSCGKREGTARQGEVRGGARSV